MKNIQYTESTGIPHSSMAEEFLSHRQGSEWWYCTGSVKDKNGREFSFQFTLARVRIFNIQFHILMTALTDIETEQHFYEQKPIFFGKDVVITEEQVGLPGTAEMRFHGKELSLQMAGEGYSLSLNLRASKDPVWHCEDGILRMGVDDPKERTYYWSYTNLATSGTIRLGEVDHKVTGKSWFDKQGGTYTLTNRWTNWEWFSLRFFDGEEVMLFSFPQDDYQDGTYITKSGNYNRLVDYEITPLDFTEARGNRFSYGWAVNLKNIKQGKYTIIPKTSGQLNFFYFELLAEIKDGSGETVGQCFVELLPGVYNKTKPLAAFAKIK